MTSLTNSHLPTHLPSTEPTPSRPHLRPRVARAAVPASLGLCALILLALATGCASTKTTSRERFVTEKLPKPDHILVHDFIANASDLPTGSAMAGQFESHPKPQTPEDIEEGRKLGADMAGQLVGKIRALGMPAACAGQGVTPRLNDIVLHGYLVAIHEELMCARMQKELTQKAGHFPAA